MADVRGQRASVGIRCLQTQLISVKDGVRDREGEGEGLNGIPSINRLNYQMRGGIENTETKVDVNGEGGLEFLEGEGRQHFAVAELQGGGCLDVRRVWLR